MAGSRPRRGSADPYHHRPSFRFALKRSRLLPWNQRYVLKSYVSGSMWLVPLVALLVYAAFHRVVHAIGAWMVERGWTSDATSFQALPLAGARSLLETLITLNLSFLVFTFGSLLVAIQVAGGQYTPRIIATTLLRDNVIRTTVGVFVFTLAFCVRVLSRMKDTVNQLDLFVAGVLGTVSVMVFLYLIDYAARLLRPVSIVRRVGESGLGVIRSVYPAPTVGEHPSEPARPREAAARVVLHEGVSGVVLAVDLAGLVRLARKADGVIEFVPGVGDFLGGRRAPLQAVRRRCRDRRSAPARKGRARQRADPGAGPDLRPAHPGRHRHQGLVGRDQRSDDGRHGDRPAPSPAAPGRPALAAQRGAARCAQASCASCI